MTTKSTKPTRPACIAARGRGARLWRDVVDTYDLRIDELTVLEHACRHLDLCDRLAKALEKVPLVVAGSKGQDAPHPLLAELRQSRALVAALLRQLHLPDNLGELDAAQVASMAGRRAARARWDAG